jgi:hypothetical protein
MRTVLKIISIWSGGGDATPGGSFDAILMEDGTSGVLMEDGTSDILLES